jgi:hypothetical protein
LRARESGQQAWPIIHRPRASGCRRLCNEFSHTAVSADAESNGIGSQAQKRTYVHTYNNGRTRKLPKTQSARFACRASIRLKLRSHCCSWQTRWYSATGQRGRNHENENNSNIVETMNHSSLTFQTQRVVLQRSCLEW